MSDPQALLERIQALPPDRIAEIEDFVAFITVREQERALVRSAAQSSAATFAAVWDNPDDAAYDEL